MPRRWSRPVWSSAGKPAVEYDSASNLKVNVAAGAAGRRVGEPVTVSLAGLAASAVAFVPGGGWYDLGPDWSPAMVVVGNRANGVGSANERMALECCDDTTGAVVLLGVSVAGAISSNNQVLTASGSDVGALFRPVARYCRLRYTNGSTAQNLTAILRLLAGAPA